jgi:hypothetical protein
MHFIECDLSGVVNPIIKARCAATNKMSAVATITRVEYRGTNDDSAAISADSA